MFEQFYTTGALDIIKENFDLYISNEITYTLCNVKLIELFKTMDQLGLPNLRDYAGENIYAGVENITYDDLFNALDNGDFYDDAINRSFVKCYEIFQSTIEEIIRYIHYKRVDIVLNKGNSISCDRLKSKNTEELTEELIQNHVAKLVYNQGIKDMLLFIKRYSKGDIDELLVKGAYVNSKIRNAFVHDNGLMDNKIIQLAEGIYEFNADEIPNGEFQLTMDLESLGIANKIYKKIVCKIIDDMKKQFETNG